MANIKEFFTIKDLENITGVSAHSIRIWERRYQILHPYRTENNKRFYDLEQLKKLLNISLLKQKGYKISEIAVLPKEEIFNLSKVIVGEKYQKANILAKMKMAMYKFDSELFEKAYEKVIQDKSFSELFQLVFLPLLHFLGSFWHTNTITIAHEHFISSLIYQKIQLNIARLENKSPKKSGPIFVLYLPEEEMHEIGLLYLNYELLANNYQTIYLGRSVPIEDLNYLKYLHSNLCWIGIFTMKPEPKQFEEYIDKVTSLLDNSNHQYWAIGQNLNALYKKIKPKNLLIFNSIKEILNKILVCLIKTDFY